MTPAPQGPHVRASSPCPGMRGLWAVPALPGLTWIQLRGQSTCRCSGPRVCPSRPLPAPPGPPPVSPSAWTLAASKDPVLPVVAVCSASPPAPASPTPGSLCVLGGCECHSGSVTAVSRRTRSASGWAGTLPAPPGLPQLQARCTRALGARRAPVPPRACRPYLPDDRWGPSLKPPRARGRGRPHGARSSSAAGGGVPVGSRSVPHGGSPSGGRAGPPQARSGRGRVRGPAVVGCTDAQRRPGTERLLEASPRAWAFSRAAQQVAGSGAGRPACVRGPAHLVTPPSYICESLCHAP